MNGAVDDFVLCGAILLSPALQRLPIEERLPAVAVSSLDSSQGRCRDRQRDQKNQSFHSGFLLR